MWTKISIIIRTFTIKIDINIIKIMTRIRFKKIIIVLKIKTMIRELMLRL